MENNLITEIAKKAKEASRIIAEADSAGKNLALIKMAENIKKNMQQILLANAKDLASLDKNETDAFRDRLLLNEDRVEKIVASLKHIASLPDPVGRVISSKTLPNGIILNKISVPIGVIAVIYESRPNVTSDAGALCMKAGNASILRGGKESFFSANEIMSSLRKGLRESNLPEDIIQIIPLQDRSLLGELIKYDNYIDLLIPRGGKGLLKFIKENSSIPLLLHLDGLCHTYIHQDADLDKTVKIILNAKMRRTGVCNATETVLIDRNILSTHLLPIVNALFDAGCEIRGDEEIMKFDSRIKPAAEEDWQTEYLDAILSIKTVSDVNEAVEHIEKYSSKHTEAIITENKAAAETFLHRISSAVVMWNTSTQFCDGGEFGMGAEIGISTGKLHARGPVGLEELNTYKYNLIGNGQIRPK